MIGSSGIALRCGESRLSRPSLFQCPVVSPVVLIPAVRREKAAAVLPKPGPDAFTVRLRQFQGHQFLAPDKLKPAFAMRRREGIELWFDLKKKHQPMVPPVPALADDSGQVQIRNRNSHLHLLPCLATGTSIR